MNYIGLDYQFKRKCEECFEMIEEKRRSTVYEHTCLIAQGEGVLKHLESLLHIP